MDRALLHVDADAFFAAVEQRDDPSLRGRPVAVGTGVVMAASYEARRFGVRGGMGGAEARRRCPGLVQVPGRFEAYSAASKELFRCFRAAAPRVEGLSLEEAFLDVTGLEAIGPGPAEIGATLRATCAREVGLAVTVGVARTRMAAKMASRAAKPDGLLALGSPSEELAFVRGLAVEDVWGIGPATAAELHAYGLRRVGDLVGLGEEALVAIMGRARGRWLHAVAHDLEPPRRARRGRRSVGAQHAIRRSGWSDELDRVLSGLVERVTRRLRKADLSGRTVVLRLRFGDFEAATRSRTLPVATQATAPVLEAARRLLAESRGLIEARAVTLVGVAVTGLGEPGSGEQLALALDGPREGAALDRTLDDLAERFGKGAVVRGARSRGEDRPSAWQRPEDEEGWAA